MANQKPFAKVRIGAVKGAIWQNQAGDHTRYSVTFSKSYRDADGQWKTTQSWFSPRSPTKRTRASSRFNRPRKSRKKPNRHSGWAAGTSRRPSFSVTTGRFLPARPFRHNGTPFKK